jgi:hypothetical protein
MHPPHGRGPSCTYEVAEKVIEIHALRDGELQRSKHLQERCEDRVIEAQIMAEANMGGSSSPPTADRQSEHSDREVITLDDNTSLEDALFQKQGGKKPAALDNNTFVQTIKDYYQKDKLFMLILEKPKEYTNFSIREDIIRTTNPCSDEVVCVPRNHELITQLNTFVVGTGGHR